MNMNNQTPMPGTPAGVLANFQALNPLENSTFGKANAYRNLLDSLNDSRFKVADIVVIQTNNGGSANADATAVPFSQLRNLGVTETDYLYIFLKRVVGGVDKLDNVALLTNLASSVGNDNWGAKNVYQAFVNIIQSLAPGEISASEVPSLLLGAEEVSKAVNTQLNKFLAL
jgi:hypothetical protein